MRIKGKNGIFMPGNIVHYDRGTWIYLCTAIRDKKQYAILQYPETENMAILAEFDKRKITLTNGCPICMQGQKKMML